MPVDRKDPLGHAQRHGLVLEEGSKHGKIVDPESGRVYTYPRGSKARRPASSPTPTCAGTVVRSGLTLSRSAKSFDSYATSPSRCPEQRWTG